MPCPRTQNLFLKRFRPRSFQFAARSSTTGPLGSLCNGLSWDCKAFSIGSAFAWHKCFSRHLSRCMRKPDFAYAKTKPQISCAVTAQLISAFVFVTWIVQFVLYLYQIFQDSSFFLSLYRLVCDKPGRKPQRLVFSRRGSFLTDTLSDALVYTRYQVCSCAQLRFFISTVSNKL